MTQMFVTIRQNTNNYHSYAHASKGKNHPLQEQIDNINKKNGSSDKGPKRNDKNQ